jgi:hypothetical protein
MKLYTTKKCLLSSNRDNSLHHPILINRERKNLHKSEICGCCCSHLAQQISRDRSGISNLMKHTFIFNFSTLHYFQATYASSMFQHKIINSVLHILVQVYMYKGIRHRIAETETVTRFLNS